VRPPESFKPREAHRPVHVAWRKFGRPSAGGPSMKGVTLETLIDMERNRAVANGKALSP